MSENEPDELTPSEPIPVIGANFWIRAVAHTIDFTILMMITCLITMPFLLRTVIRTLQQGGAADPTAMSFPIWVDLAYQLILAVGVITLWRKTQTTPGKAIFRLKIVDLRDGGRPSLPRLVVRFFGYLVAMVPIPLPLVTLVFPSLRNLPHYGLLFDDWRMLVPLMFGFFWILVDPRNRGWHDLMSGTITVSKPRPAK